MAKILDLSKSIYEQASLNEDFLDIMEGLGFDHMRICVVENPRTKVLTLKDVALNHNIDLNLIIETFKNAGFEIIE